MNTTELTELVRGLQDHGHPTTDISQAIQIACSRLHFNPYQSRERSKAIQALRRNRGGKSKRPTSNAFFWLALHEWSASDLSSLIILEGSPPTKDQIEEIATETIDLIESRDVPVIWALNVQPKPLGGDDPKKCSGQDVLAQLCLQLLQKNARLHLRSRLATCLSNFERATAGWEWFEVLTSLIEGLPEVYVIVDLESMDQRNAGALSWPTAFRDVFGGLLARGIHSIVKVILFTCHPIATQDTLDVRVVRFPRQSSRILHRGHSYRSQHQNQGLSSVKGDRLWLDFVGKARKSKRVRPTSENDNSDNEGDTMAVPMSKRRHNPSTWFDFMAEEFETCIDGSRKDGPSSSFPRVKIAVLDTGADLSHPDIIDATQKGLLKYYDFVKNESTMSDLDGHGTHCTSLLLKFAPNAEIHIGRVFQRRRASASSLVTLANAIKYATETWGVDIISISLGFPEVDTDVMREIKTAAAKPVLIFASAANNTVHERKPIRFPAQMKEVFCIFSADTNGIESSFNPKPRYDRDNFMFPGENIEGAWPLAPAGVSPETETREGRTYRRLSGTSCATPIAAAVAAGVLEFAWQGRETKIRRVEMLKHFDGMKDVFLEMLDKYKPGDGCYHYVKPWRLITTRRPKSEIPVLLSYIIEQINA